MDRGYEVYPEPEGLIFTEDWCTDLEKSAIEFAILETQDLPRGIDVEIGSFEGRSAVFTANLMVSLTEKGGTPRQLHTIDPHEPVEYADYEKKVYASRPIAEHFRHNIEVGTEGNILHHPVGYEEWFADRPISVRYCYLDGPHGYEDVQKGLRTVVPLLVSGGIIIGDDYDDAIVKQAVDDYFGHEVLHPLSNRTFLWKKD